MTMRIDGSVGITFPDGTTQTTASTGGGISTVTAVAPLTSSGGAHPAISLSGIVPPANGGLGAASLTGLLSGHGACADRICFLHIPAASSPSASQHFGRCQCSEPCLLRRRGGDGLLYSASRDTTILVWETTE